jgi:hypothetical protein
MHSGPNLPLAPSGLPREPGFVPATTLTDDGGFRPTLDGALGQIVLNRGGADADAACTCGAGTRSVREFPQFEHGAGV